MFQAMKNVLYRWGASLYVKSLGLHDLTEESAFLHFLCKAGLDSASKILDVGCGKGRNLFLLKNHGFNPIGVETNPCLVSEVRRNGFICLNPSDFCKTTDIYDAIIMAHLLEHFSPDKLVDFLDGYFDRLRIGGCVIIATPLLTRAFYNDFDHIRPYLPMGIDHVFCCVNAQVQYQARNRFEKISIVYRRGPFNGYFWGQSGVVAACVTMLGLIIYVISFKRIGFRSGWIGLYKKLGENGL